MLVSTRSTGSGLNVEGPTGATPASSGSNADYSWAMFNAPAPGSYTVTGLSGVAKLYAFRDLSLRTRFGIDAPGLGRPMRLWAEVSFEGRPVSGATIKATSSLPASSSGEVLTHALQAGLISRAVAQKLIDPKLFQEARAIAQGRTTQADVPSMRSQLLDVVDRLKEAPLSHNDVEIQLLEVQPGRYEYTLSPLVTQNEGGYSFSFRAEGETPSGHLFTRDKRRSVEFIPELEPTLSSVSVTKTERGVRVTVFPVSVSGKPVGPGVSPSLEYHYVDVNLRERGEALVTVDNLDGTYSVEVPGEKGAVPQVGLYLGAPVSGNRPVLSRPSSSKGLRRVQVVLEQIQIIDDEDPFLRGSGELVFKAMVMANASPTRAQATRIPRSGNLSLGSGQVEKLGVAIFDGELEMGACLAISVFAEELDWPYCLNRDDVRSRYLRVLKVPETSLRISPETEVDDPKLRMDWKLWYSILVS